MRDVARAAGVSAQTVSRVINDHSSIRPETRQRVLEAMETLGYRVNNAARALGTDRSHVLGVLASDATLFGPGAGIAALERAAREAGRWVTTAYADAADPASVDAAVRHLLDQGVDGILLVAQRIDTVARLESHATVPVLALHQGTALQADAAALVVAHLADLGHRRIARIGGPDGWIEEAARAEGFDTAVGAHGMTVTDRWAGDWSAASGAAAAPAVLAAIARADGPTAVVVANDQMALGLMSALADAGRGIPSDISVVGFDDNPDAAHYRPALSSVRLDIAGEARRCVAAVLDAAAPPSIDAPVLAARASTAPPTR